MTDDPTDGPTEPTDSEATTAPNDDQTDTTEGDTTEKDLHAELQELKDQLENRTVHRDTIEKDLKAYIRRRQRHSHARGWGPYIVLLYGTVMTLGAFQFLAGGWAIAAMVVIWLSTLGLYTLMVLVGIAISAFGLPGRLYDRLGR